MESLRAGLHSHRPPTAIRGACIEPLHQGSYCQDGGAERRPKRDDGHPLGRMPIENRLAAHL